MNGVALSLYLLYFIAAFGWRSWIQRKRTGDTGLRLGAERGTVEWWAKLSFIVAIVAGIAAPVAGLAGLSALPMLDHDVIRTAGLVVATTGIVGTLWTQHHMGQSWRVGVDPKERTGLVTTGVFSVVRNPVFTAMALTGAGLALLVGNVIAVIGFATLAAALEIQVRWVEEPYLKAVHGAAYERYADATGRFIPGVGRRLPGRR